MGSRAPFGYQKDPNDRHHLIVDPPAADVVRDIFRMFADGIGYVRMTKILREKGALNPQAYPATSSKKAAFLMGMLLFYFSRPEPQSRVAA